MNNAFKFSVEMNINKEWYVVYMHHTPVGELIYIGFDTIANMFRYHHLARSEMWKRKVQEFNGKYTVSLYDTYSSRLDAMKAANALRVHLKPTSQTGNKKNSAIVRCVDTGMHYVSASCASKMWGINPSVMSRHLRRDKGFMKVQGLTFERLFINELPHDTLITLPTGQIVPFGSTIRPVKVEAPPQAVDTDKQLTEARLQEMYARDRLTALPDDTETYEQFKVAMVAALAGDGYVYIPDAPTAPVERVQLYEAYKPDLRARRDMSEEDMVQVHNHYLMENKMPRFPPMTMDEFKQWLTDNDEWAE